MTPLLADTHILLWALDQMERLPRDLREDLDSQEVQPVFSIISIWEIAIKANLGRAGFRVDPPLIRATLLEDRWSELRFEGEHALAAAALPRLHADPFDRALLGQAEVEGVEFVTADVMLARYPGKIRLI